MMKTLEQVVSSQVPTVTLQTQDGWRMHLLTLMPADDLEDKPHAWWETGFLMAMVMMWAGYTGCLW